MTLHVDVRRRGGASERATHAVFSMYARAVLAASLGQPSRRRSHGSVARCGVGLCDDFEKVNDLSSGQSVDGSIQMHPPDMVEWSTSTPRSSSINMRSR